MLNHPPNFSTVPPVLSLTKSPVSVLEGSNLVLSCKASGTSVSSFQWRKNSIDKESPKNFYHKNFQSFSLGSSGNQAAIHQTSATSLSGLHNTFHSSERGGELNGAKNNLYDQELVSAQLLYDLNPYYHSHFTRFILKTKYMTSMEF